MKNKINIILGFICLYMLTSCSGRDIELITKTEYPELGNYARFSLYIVGDYEQMASEVDSVLSLEVAPWKGIDDKDRKIFKEGFIKQIKYQMDNDEWVVYKSAVYHLNGIAEENDPITIKVNLGIPKHAYKKNQRPLIDQVQFQNVIVSINKWTLRVPVTIEISSASKVLGELKYKNGYVLETEKDIFEFAESIHTK